MSKTAGKSTPSRPQPRRARREVPTGPHVVQLPAPTAAVVAVLATVAKVVEDGGVGEGRAALAAHVALAVEALAPALVGVVGEAAEAEGAVVVEDDLVVVGRLCRRPPAEECKGERGDAWESVERWLLFRCGCRGATVEQGDGSHGGRGEGMLWHLVCEVYICSCTGESSDVALASCGGTWLSSMKWEDNDFRTRLPGCL